MSKQFKKVRGILSPREEHFHTFKEEYKKFIGKEFVFQYSFQFEDDEIFPGIWAMQVMPNNDEFVTSWVPEFDIKIIEEVECFEIK